MMTKNDRASSLLIQILLGALFFLFTIPLARFAIQAGDPLLQQDFSAYYTAGQALNYGLSPYLNNLSNIPPLWDGIAHFKFSRFLYPPLAAALFRPLALVPYPSAKILWVLFTLVCLIVSLVLTATIFPLKSLIQMCLVGIAASLYYPLYTHLDRGQIDLVTLLLMTVALVFLTKKTSRSDWLSGLFLALATLLKLHCIYILPFLLIRRKWTILRGYILGGVLIMLASIIFLGGWRSLYDYLRYELPRISGLVSPDDTLGRTNKTILDRIMQNVPADYTVKDGQVYKSSAYSSLEQVTLVEPLYYGLEGKNVPVSRTLLSVGLYGIFFVLIWVWERKYGPLFATAQEEFLSWQIPVLLILLTSPLTWIMNLVWLIPFPLMLVSRYPGLHSRRQGFSSWIIATGFLIIMMGDNLFPGLNLVGLNKFIIGELLILGGLILHLTITDRSTGDWPADTNS
jgi:Glycosyltransferase family 87